MYRPCIVSNSEVKELFGDTESDSATTSTTELASLPFRVTYRRHLKPKSKFESDYHLEYGSISVISRITSSHILTFLNSNILTQQIINEKDLMRAEYTYPQVFNPIFENCKDSVVLRVLHIDIADEVCYTCAYHFTIYLAH
jgi:hypothetical protein